MTTKTITIEDLPKAAQQQAEEAKEWVDRQQAALDESGDAVRRMFKGESLSQKDRQVLGAVVGLPPSDIEGLHEADYDDDLKARERRFFREPQAHFYYESKQYGLVRVDVTGDGVTVTPEDDESFS